MRDYYNTKEYADLLGVSIKTVCNWIKNGSIEAEHKTKHGRWYISKLEVPTFMRERE